MNLLVQMAQAVAFQDITATLLMCTYKQNFKLITNAQEKIFNKNRGAKVSKKYVFLLFSTNLIYAEFDSLREKTKEFFFPIDVASCCVFSAEGAVD